MIYFKIFIFCSASPYLPNSFISKLSQNEYLFLLIQGEIIANLILLSFINNNSILITLIRNRANKKKKKKEEFQFYSRVK